MGLYHLSRIILGSLRKQAKCVYISFNWIILYEKTTFDIYFHIGSFCLLQKNDVHVYHIFKLAATIIHISS